MIKTWLDLHREDLRSIPMMEEKGFTTVFSYDDKGYKRTTPDNAPHFPVNFKKNDLHIWKIKTGWQTAYLTATHYVKHILFQTIEEASQRGSVNAFEE